jgi:hypothetical protein
MKPFRFAHLGAMAVAPLALSLYACGSSAGSGSEPEMGDASSGGDGGFDAGSLPAFDAQQEDVAAMLDAAPILDASVDTSDGFDGFICDTSQTPMQSGCVVSDSIGVFVAPSPAGSDTNPGTMASPVADVQTAITTAVAAGKHRVYVCAAEYASAISITALTATEDLAIYGGLACPGTNDAGPSSWSYTGAPTTMAPPTGTALTVSQFGHSLLVEDLALSSVDATGNDADGNGASSIAVVVGNSGNVTFVRAALSAGAGAAGAPGGTAPENHAAVVSPGSPPTNQTVGGVAVACTCGDGSTSVGGAGGTYGAVNMSGSAGSSTPPATAMAPNINGVGSGATAVNQACGAPGLGAAGAAGAPGTGATSVGAFGSSGWVPSGGGAGGSGAPGQGGGGAGADLNVNQGGGGGACGGCGGGGGVAGGGGGASIALEITSSTVTLTSTALFTTNGGAGGAGGAGEVGQAGASGNDGVAKCSGANGGFGAGGGGGGGGAGGSVFGIAWTGSSSMLTIDATPITSDVATASYFTAGSVGDAGGAGSPGAVAPGGTAPFVGYAGNAGSAAISGSVAAVRKF